MERRPGKAEETRPFPTGLWLMCHCLLLMFGEKVGRRMTSYLWCFHLFGIPIRSSVCHLIVSSLCKEKSTRLLRTEVSDNVPEFSGPFFVVVLIKLLFVFPIVCGHLLVV